jgi:mycofactocin system creatininase family protein
VNLAERVWPEVGAQLLLVPTGSCEQHGPHLPFDTDTRIATAVAGGCPEALVAPPISYGSSGEHEEFPGTVSIGQEASKAVLVEFGRSACRWASRLVFVNGHGGNVNALASAVRLLRYEARDVAWFGCGVPGGDAHAGRAETALMLAIDPSAVRLDRAAAGNTAPLRELLPRLRDGNLRELSPNGVLGDPAGATAEAGQAMLAEMISLLTKAVDRWQPDELGRIQ